MCPPPPPSRLSCPVTPLTPCTAPQRAQDAVQLLSLAVLLSSTFVFNQMGPIDEAALDRLSLVTQITKHVRVRATAPAAGVFVCCMLAAAGPAAGVPLLHQPHLHCTAH
jgi:hypothetical protein